MIRNVGDLIAALERFPLLTPIIVPDADSGGYDVTWHVGVEIASAEDYVGLETTRPGTDGIFPIWFEGKERKRLEGIPGESDKEVFNRIFPVMPLLLQGSGEELWDILAQNRRRT